MTRQLPGLLAGCTACGKCLAQCPVYRQSGKAADSPRGKVALLLAALAGKLTFREIAPALAACTLCGKCESACPAGLALTEAFLQGRALATAWLAIAPKRKYAARCAALPGFADLVAAAVALGQRLHRKAGLNGPMPVIRPWRLPKSAKTGPGPAVLLFTGCLARRFLPHVAQAACNILQKGGYTVLTMPGSGCCGRPLALQGQSIAGLVRRNLGLLAKLEFTLLATPCPGCLDAITRIWPRTPGLDKAEKSQLASLVGRCRDINTFIGPEHGSPGDIGTVFWHKPCLLGQDAEHVVLARLGGAVKAASGPAACCGAPLGCLDQETAGVRFGKPVTQAEALAREIRGQSAEAALLVTACPGCMLALKRINGVIVKHSAEIFGWETARH